MRSCTGRCRQCGARLTYSSKPDGLPGFVLIRHGDAEPPLVLPSRPATVADLRALADWQATIHARSRTAVLSA